MKKSLVLSLLFASAMFAQGPRGGGAFFGGGGGRGQALVTGAPYSAVSLVQSQEVLSDGNRITNQRTSNVARDGQGRVRTEETVKARAATATTPARPATTLVTILDYVSGNRYVLDSAAMTAHQSPLRTPRPGGFTRTPAAAPTGPVTLSNGATITTTTLPAQHINGVLSTGKQITEIIPAGAIGNAQPIQVTRVTWVSNDLKVPVQIKSSDPRFGTTDMELTNIVQSEPNSSLFVVPSSYTIKNEGGRGGGFGPAGEGSRARGPRGGAVH